MSAAMKSQLKWSRTRCAEEDEAFTILEKDRHVEKCMNPEAMRWLKAVRRWRRRSHACKDCVAVRQALQADGELHIRGADDVLHLEVLEARIVAQLRDDLAILQHGRQLSVIYSAGLLCRMPSFSLRLPGDHVWLYAVCILIEQIGRYERLLCTFRAAFLASSSLFAPVTT